MFKKAMNGLELEKHWFGKPLSSTYRYAEDMLHKQAKKLGYTNGITQFYGIGDNPHADILGANDAGKNWSSILVEIKMIKQISRT